MFTANLPQTLHPVAHDGDLPWPVACNFLEPGNGEQQVLIAVESIFFCSCPQVEREGRRLGRVGDGGRGDERERHGETIVGESFGDGR